MQFEDAMTVVGRHADGRLLAGRIGNVGVMLFNQPDKLNAISLEMWDGVAAALDLFATQDDVRVVIYAGVGGKAFVSGGDISQFAARRPDAAANVEFVRLGSAGRGKLEAFQKPSVACLQGWCLGGGLAIALEADLRVAAADAVFGVPAARLGVAYGVQPLKRLVALVGPSRARMIMYTARRFGAEEALAIGLVDRVAPAADVTSEALELARSIADNAPLSVLAAKFAIDEIGDAPGDIGIDLDGIAERTRRCLDSDDYREGRTAFMEKRRPVFTGK